MKFKFWSLFIVLMITATIFSMLHFSTWALILLSIISGLLKEFRKLKNELRFLTYLFQSAAVLILSIPIQSYIIVEFETVLLPFWNISTIFTLLMAYPLLAYIMSKTRLDKIACIILVFMIFSSSLVILFDRSHRTVINELQDDRVNYLINQLEKQALMNLEPIMRHDHLQSYAQVYDVRNGIFDYGLFKVYFIYWCTYWINTTHYIIMIGTGFAVIPYQTDYGRVLIQNTSFECKVYFNTDPTPRNFHIYAVRYKDIYAEVRLFIFSRKLFPWANVIFREVWILKEIFLFDGHKVYLDEGLSIKYWVNATMVGSKSLLMIKIVPEEFLEHVITYYVNYNPNFSLFETLLFYKYEISMGLIFIISLCLLIDYRSTLSNMMRKLIKSTGKH